jgi:putative transcriptional regulator
MGRMVPLTGRLLVATPHLIDPNFHRTVVLICRHDDEGALGIVLNRPTEIVVGDHLPGWTDVVAEPPLVFSGGPVQPEVAIGLARRRRAVTPPGWTDVYERIGLLDLGAPAAEGVATVETLRVYSGYAGWSGGQLDFESASGDWFVVDALPDDPFPTEAEAMWRRVLRRQGGDLSLYADFPPDPTLN